MSHEKNDNTNITPVARTVIKASDAREYLTPDVFSDLEMDYELGLNVWRQVPKRFARFVFEAGESISGPEGSGSYARGECHDVTLQGAVHCVIAHESDEYYAKYVCLMDWGASLLDLREALECGRTDS